MSDEPQNPPIEPFDDGNGRKPNGQFAKGNPGGPGNPHAATVLKMRQAYCDSFDGSEPRMDRRVLNRIIRNRKSKDADKIAAIRLKWSYDFGTPTDVLVNARLDAIEENIKRKENQ